MLLGVLGGVALTLLRARGAAGSDEHFRAWAAAVGRAYASEEERLMRYEHWLASYMHVQSHRQRNPEAPYEVGLNEFSDWSPQEKRQRLLGLRVGGGAAFRWVARGPAAAAA